MDLKLGILFIGLMLGLGLGLMAGISIAPDRSHEPVSETFVLKCTYTEGVIACHVSNDPH